MTRRRIRPRYRHRNRSEASAPVRLFLSSANCARGPSLLPPRMFFFRFLCPLLLVLPWRSPRLSAVHVASFAPNAFACLQRAHACRCEHDHRERVLLLSFSIVVCHHLRLNRSYSKKFRSTMRAVEHRFVKPDPKRVMRKPTAWNSGMAVIVREASDARAPDGSVGVVAVARTQDGDGGNTGSPDGVVARGNRSPVRGGPGRSRVPPLVAQRVLRIRFGLIADRAIQHRREPGLCALRPEVAGGHDVRRVVQGPGLPRLDAPPPGEPRGMGERAVRGSAFSRVNLWGSCPTKSRVFPSPRCHLYYVRRSMAGDDRRPRAVLPGRRRGREWLPRG